MVAMASDRRESARPLAVVAWPDTARAAALGRLLREEGWRVLRADTGALARRMALRLRPAAIVLAADLPDESGWLVCAKLARCRRRTRVIMLDADTPERDRFAAFVGAAARVNPAVPPRQLAARVTGLVPVGV